MPSNSKRMTRELRTNYLRNKLEQKKCSRAFLLLVNIRESIESVRSNYIIWRYKVVEDSHQSKAKINDIDVFYANKRERLSKNVFFF